MAENEKKEADAKKTEEQVTYKIQLKVLDRETGESRYVTLDEAKSWEWSNPEIWRMIGGWQVTSFQQLLNILYLKMQKGVKEVEMLEAPRFTMLSGG